MSVLSHTKSLKWVRSLDTSTTIVLYRKVSKQRWQPSTTEVEFVITIIYRQRGREGYVFNNKIKEGMRVRVTKNLMCYLMVKKMAGGYVQCERKNESDPIWTFMIFVSLVQNFNLYWTKLYTQHFCFCPHFSWAETFSMCTKGLFLSNIVHKSV